MKDRSLLGLDPTARRRLGRTELFVTPVCIGAGPLGSVPKSFGHDVSVEQGVATAMSALRGPFNFLDTSGNYSDGESERRIGIAIARCGGLPADFVLATKVEADAGRDEAPATHVQRSLESSLLRLGVDSVPLLYLHDPEKIGFDTVTARSGPLDGLLRLREDGLAQHIGVAGGPVDLMRQLLRTGAFDVLLTHNRWTLLDQSAGELLDEAVALDVGIVNAAPFSSGILAKGPTRDARYLYRPASESMLARIRQMSDACAAVGVPLAAAALQFSLRDPRIGATTIGASRPDRIDEAVALANYPVPPELWTTLGSLALPPDMWLW